jgi:integrase
MDLPKQNRRRVGVLSVEQARTFMKAIAGHPYEALFALAMTSGMRPSEYLALTGNDVDSSPGTASVCRTLEWRKGGWQFADTKRSRSRRVVKLQTWVMALLREQVSNARNSCRKNFIFRAKRGGPIREPHFVQRYFRPLLKATQLPNIRLYDLRHTAATLALATDVSPKIVNEQLGHVSVAFTLAHAGLRPRKRFRRCCCRHRPPMAVAYPTFVTVTRGADISVTHCGSVKPFKYVTC